MAHPATAPTAFPASFSLTALHPQPSSWDQTQILTSDCILESAG